MRFPYLVPCTYEACFESVLCAYSLSLSLSLFSLVLDGFWYVSGFATVCATTGVVGPERVGFPTSISSWFETPVVPPFYTHARNNATT